MQQVPRRGLRPGLWDQFVFAHPHGWWFHRETWLDYSMAYAPGSADFSYGLVGEHGLFAVVPLLMRDGARVTYGGQQPPSILVAGAQGYRDLNEGGPVQEWRPGEAVSVPPPAGHVLAEESTHVISLECEERDLWRGLRKSYKSLIHKTEREYTVDVFSGANAEEAVWRMRLAQQLHREVSGRATRSDKTWALQTDWITSGNGILVSAFKGTEMRAFVYVLRWKGWSLYFSAASLDRSVSHALIWQAMRTMRCDGETRYFEMGREATGERDEKAVGISFFKSGFGGSMMPVVRIEAEQVHA